MDIGTMCKYIELLPLLDVLWAEAIDKMNGHMSLDPHSLYLLPEVTYFPQSNQPYVRYAEG